MSESTLSNGDDSVTRFEGFSDYQRVSNAIASSIDGAIEGYAQLESMHQEDYRISAGEAADARSRIKGAALKVIPELRDDAPDDEQYQKILARWLGSFTVGDEVVTPTYNGYQPDGDGYLDALNNVSLRQSCPAWLEQFVIDIRTAGWELGYLQAGRTVSESNLEPADEEARSMFES